MSEPTDALRIGILTPQWIGVAKPAEFGMIYAVNYDLKVPGQDYAALYEAIKNCGDWWHYLGSTWLVDTGLSAAGIWDSIAAHVDKNDNVLIVGVTKDYSGWLPEGAWEWINSRL